MKKMLILLCFLTLTLSACSNKKMMLGKKCMQETENNIIKTTKSYVWFVSKDMDWSNDINKANCN